MNRPLSFFLLFAFCFLPFQFCFSISLSDSSVVSLLTVAPGEELYSAFGHTGIRIKDDSSKVDVVFNYGTFDFEQPGFYTNFIKGKMRYMISWDYFPNFEAQYIYEKRSIIEQVLRLNADERQKIFYFLENNVRPENREYFYDFFWDNCSTRPRNVFEKVLGDNLKYDFSKFDTAKTLRQCLKPYVENFPWIDFGFDLILGLPCEKKATPLDQTFLPDKLQLLFEGASVNGEPFVTLNKNILSLPSPQKEFTGVRPIHVTLLLTLFGLLLSFLPKLKSALRFFDFTLFFFAGIFGTFFLCMWLFTSHYSTPKNLNMLWLLPTHLFFCFFLLKKQKPLWLKYYFGVAAAISFLLLAGWNWLPQQFSIAAMPLVFLLFLRSSQIFYSFFAKS